MFPHHPVSHFIGILQIYVVISFAMDDFYYTRQPSDCFDFINRIPFFYLFLDQF